MNKKISSLIIIIILLFLSLFFIRLVSHREIDDVSPEIPCSEKYLEKSDVLWVIPKFNNKLISENERWCEEIFGLNKTLGMHGVSHKFEEFSINRNKDYLQEGMNLFEKCFGFKPEIFKPPQLKITDGNKKLVKDSGMRLKGQFNQLTHKVYHCNNTGLFTNWVIDLV